MHVLQNYDSLADFTGFLQGHGARWSGCNHALLAMKAAQKYGFAGLGYGSFKHKNAGSGIVIPGAVAVLAGPFPFLTLPTRPDSWQKYDPLLVKNHTICYKTDMCSGMQLPGQVCTGDKKGTRTRHNNHTRLVL